MRVAAFSRIGRFPDSACESLGCWVGEAMASPGVAVRGHASPSKGGGAWRDKTPIGGERVSGTTEPASPWRWRPRPGERVSPGRPVLPWAERHHAGSGPGRGPSVPGERVGEAAGGTGHWRGTILCSLDHRGAIDLLSGCGADKGGDVSGSPLQRPCCRARPCRGDSGRHVGWSPECRPRAFATQCLQRPSRWFGAPSPKPVLRRSDGPPSREPWGTVSHALQPDASKPERRPRGPQRRVEAAAQEHRGAAAAKRLGSANRGCPDHGVARCRAQDVAAAADAERRPLRRKCFPYGWSASTSGE